MYVAQLNLSSTVHWSKNAVTVAGSWSGQDGSSLNKLYWNSGLYIADDGILYVADTGNRRIVLIKPNSTTAVATIGTGSISGGFEFGSVVDVFVSKTYIYVLDRGAEQVQKWLINASNPNTVYGNPQSIISIPQSSYFFVDKDNNLYVSGSYTATVIRIPSDSSNGNNGVVVAGNGIYGSGPEQLTYPCGIFVDDARTVYVADSNNHRIQKWAVEASFGVTVAGNGMCNINSLSQICNPTSVVVDSNQYIFTVDNYFFRILRWAPNSNVGECIAACSGNEGLQSDHLSHVSAIALDGHGSLYVSDQDNNRVQKFQVIVNFGK
ncbi:unnamed protein product [Rotaria sp. Silwood2]|nr:unnamed protein product [Rotaria sp. Silwood2]CAF4410527.1 unnamed protein product [Rotaria sp. Silwood2]